MSTTRRARREDVRRGHSNRSNKFRIFAESARAKPRRVGPTCVRRFFPHLSCPPAPARRPRPPQGPAAAVTEYRIPSSSPQWASQKFVKAPSEGRGRGGGGGGGRDGSRRGGGRGPVALRGARAAAAAEAAQAAHRRGSAHPPPPPPPPRSPRLGSLTLSPAPPRTPPPSPHIYADVAGGRQGRAGGAGARRAGDAVFPQGPPPVRRRRRAQPKVSPTRPPPIPSKLSPASPSPPHRPSRAWLSHDLDVHFRG